MIYFVQSIATQLVKIGTTKCLAQRLNGLRIEAGGDVDVLGVAKGGRPEETSLHEHFQHLHVKGEWFRPEAELLEYIKQNARPWHRGLGTFTVSIDEDTEAGLQAFLNSLEYRPQFSRLFRRAIQEFLARRGFYSLPDLPHRQHRSRCVPGA